MEDVNSFSLLTLMPYVIQIIIVRNWLNHKISIFHIQLHTVQMSSFWPAHWYCRD